MSDVTTKVSVISMAKGSLRFPGFHDYDRASFSSGITICVLVVTIESDKKRRGIAREYDVNSAVWHGRCCNYGIQLK